MKRTGFTLIELLVVIAIIAILAAILFPVFAKAREKARQTACTNNQRQIVTAALMYTQDHEEMLPEAAEFWGTIGVEKASIKCPSRVRLPNGYGYNAACSGKSLGKLENPQIIPVTADADSPTASTTNGVVLFPNVVYVPSQLATPHGKKAIASFLDGHVELLPTSSIKIGYMIPLENATFETGTRAPWTGGSVYNSTNDPGYGVSPVAEGKYACVIQMGTSMSQTITVGDRWLYKLTYLAKNRNGQSNPFKITIDTTPVTTFTVAATSSTAYNLTSTPAFTLDPGMYTLTIAGTITGSDQSTFIDDIKFVAQ